MSHPLADASPQVGYGYPPVRDRGSPNHGSALFSKRVMAQIRSPAEGEDEEAHAVANAVRGAHVGSEGRLTVGSRRHEVEAPARAKDAGTEASDSIPTLVFAKGMGGIDMKTSLVRRATSASRSADSHALTNFPTIAFSEGESGAGEGSRSATSGQRRSRPERARLSALLTEPMVEPSMSATSLAGKPEDVTQDKDGELARRQDLQGGHERQGDRFRLLVAGLWAERLVECSLEKGVRIRLEPQDFPEPGRFGWFNSRARPTPWPGVDSLTDGR